MYPIAIQDTMYGTSAAMGKARPAIGAQVFKPHLAFLTESTGNPLKAQGCLFIIGCCIGIIGGIINVCFVPNMTHSSMEKVDADNFRQMLTWYRALDPRKWLRCRNNNSKVPEVKN